MATKKYVKDVQKDSGKFGHYKTGTGGGEPIPAGKKMTTEKRDPDQPRDSSGRFSYNSINGKPLKEISKVHGHSRGTTIPPTLTGGVGGIHYYSDSTHDHIVKGGQEALEKYTSLTFEDCYRKGDKIVTFDGKIAIAKKDFIESATEFVANKKGEKKLSGALAAAVEARESGDKEKLNSAIEEILESGHFEGDPTGSWERKEAETPEEKRAVASAELADTKGKELVERKREEEFAAAPKMKRFVGWAKSWSSPSTPVSEEIKKEAASVIGTENDPTASLSDEEIKKFSEKIGVEMTRSGLAEAFLDKENSGIPTVEEIKESLKEETTTEEPETEEPKAEEKVEEATEKVEEVAEEEPSEDELVKVLQGIDRKVLLDAIEKDEGARGDILPFAKKWASGKEELKGKSDIEIVTAYINEKLGKTEDEEKEEVMKDFRGE